MLRQYLLTWEDFRHGAENFQYYRMLQADQIFRDDVIRATEYETGEAQELARLAVQLLRSTPTSRWNLRFTEPHRAEVIRDLGENGPIASLHSFLQGYKDKDPTDKEAWERCQS